MQYYLIEPEVAGGLGDRTIMDRRIHPPNVSRLHYHFEGWLGDVLLESFPVFIITREARNRLDAEQVTGVTFDEVEVTKSDQFQAFHPTLDLPIFSWLKPIGKPGVDDFATLPDGRLVISQRAVDLLGATGLSHAIIERFQIAGDGP